MWVFLKHSLTNYAFHERFYTIKLLLHNKKFKESRRDKSNKKLNDYIDEMDLNLKHEEALNH